MNTDTNPAPTAAPQFALLVTGTGSAHMAQYRPGSDTAEILCATRARKFSQQGIVSDLVGNCPSCRAAAQAAIDEHRGYTDAQYDAFLAVFRTGDYAEPGQLAELLVACGLAERTAHAMADRFEAAENELADALLASRVEASYLGGR